MQNTTYRQVTLDTTPRNVVSVGIENGAAGVPLAAVWWDSKVGVDAEESQFDDVAEAFEAAEAARVLHGFDAVVVVLQSNDLWSADWGTLSTGPTEPFGHVDPQVIAPSETYELAAGIESERDA